MTKEKICENCGRFRGHYVPWGQGYTRTPSGHCAYPGLKLRYGDTKACEHYKERVEESSN